METIFLIFAIIIALWFKSLTFRHRRKRRKEYCAEYLKSDAWQRKRFVVFRRDIGPVNIAVLKQRRFITRDMRRILVRYQLSGFFPCVKNATENSINHLLQ